MKLQLGKTIIALLVVFMIAHQMNAQSCSTVIGSKSGTVYPSGPAKVQATSKGNQVKVKIRKTGGKARAEVKIFVGGILEGSMGIYQWQPNRSLANQNHQWGKR